MVQPMGQPMELLSRSAGPLSVVADRHRFGTGADSRPGWPVLPQEVPMSTITIHDVRPVRVAVRPRQATRRVTRPSTLRLTRRGRVVVVLAGLVIALVVGVFLGAGSVASERKGTPEPTRVVQVTSGDTLWAIAADAAEVTGEDDVRAMVERIQQLNALDSAMVVVGQRLRVPTD
jgi:Tfp pilus assembly protein FimV